MRNARTCTALLTLALLTPGCALEDGGDISDDDAELDEIESGFVNLLLNGAFHFGAFGTHWNRWTPDGTAGVVSVGGNYVARVADGANGATKVCQTVSLWPSMGYHLEARARRRAGGSYAQTMWTEYYDRYGKKINAGSSKVVSTSTSWHWYVMIFVTPPGTTTATICFGDGYSPQRATGTYEWDDFYLEEGTQVGV